MPTYIEISDAEIAPNQPLTTSLMTRLRDNALSYLGAPTGQKLVGRSNPAPLGWTIETGIDDRALRVVTGAISAAGGQAFSNVFGSEYFPAGTNNNSNVSNIDVPRDGWGTSGGNVSGRLLVGNGGGALPSGIEQASADQEITGTAAAQGWNPSNSKDLRVSYIDVVVIIKS